MRKKAALALWALAAGIRIALYAAGASRKLGRSIEAATPLTSTLRLAEGFWLKQLGLSPYAGSIYHGSPLLLEFIGPIVSNSFIFFLVSDLLTAFLILHIGRILSASRQQYDNLLDLSKAKDSGEAENNFDVGELAAILYLLNPFTIVACVGGSTSPFENLIICLALYGAVAGNTPLASFGWVLASHIAMYPIVLCIPVLLALSGGPDKPQSKKFRMKNLDCPYVRWSKIWSFLLWSAVWSSCILGVCSRILRNVGRLDEMLMETYGFILTVKDLTPNVGIYWYFFTEVFDFYRSFFLIVFHGNIFCMVAPLSICFHHRPVFLAFILMAIVATLKSYPSVGDAALYLGLMALFTRELSGFKYSFLLLNAYIAIAVLGPVMFNLWIWRGTGNANFYFATALAFAFVQTLLIVESVGSMLRFDRSLKPTPNKLNPHLPSSSQGQSGTSFPVQDGQSGAT